MRTYCRAEMKFIDVTALADASVTTDDNQGIGSIELFAEQTEQKSYGTFELNQFVQDYSHVPRAAHVRSDHTLF